VSVTDPAGRRLNIPVWMLLPDCAEPKIIERPHLSKESLLSLTSLLSLHLPEDHVHDNLCQPLLTDAREVIVVQLQLLDLTIGTENGIVPLDAMARADLIDLMAHILVVVFQAEGGSVDDRIVDDRGPVQSQDQAGALSAQGHRLLTAIQPETSTGEQGKPTSSV
jgi:hypothetical protein